MIYHLAERKRDEAYAEQAHAKASDCQECK